ncbi:MAG: NAD(P)/FAD-dependent oxidoreductase [Akkermansiaceae bacterium]|nr:NAD(P)/FAD-dependent oxidoreductase [Akkermansiaceae bacterium]
MSPADAPLDLAVIGGGASGFFTALRFGELAPGKRVEIFEQGKQFLQKVKISGGGRCNVTHACFEPRDLATHYPRGERELMAAFHKWQPGDTIDWFAKLGVELKTEEDGRMFPVTDSSATIIDCFLDQAKELGVALHTEHGLERIEAGADGFTLHFKNQSSITARRVCIATGSLKSSPLLKQLEALALPIEPLAPSLFAFNLKEPDLLELAGVSHPLVGIRVQGDKQGQSGPLLITHRGVSGPAVLRLSAWEARRLADAHHHFDFLIDWLPELSHEQLREDFESKRQEQGAKRVKNTPIAPIPRRLWELLCQRSGIGTEQTWGQLPKSASQKLLDKLKQSHHQAVGKTTNKDEFVTCGGISRKAIDFRTMESRSIPGLHFTGECIDLDGITGGFNFQAAWTTAHLAAKAIAEQ